MFFELGFVTIKDGFISIIQNAQKRDFSEAPSYARKHQQIKLENELLYSSYDQLYEKILAYIQGESEELKEETKTWI